MAKKPSTSFYKHMKDARKNVEAMDKIDGHKDRHLTTIESALECGLNRPESNAAYDALFMLRDLIADTRKASNGHTPV